MKLEHLSLTELAVRFCSLEDEVNAIKREVMRRAAPNDADLMDVISIDWAKLRRQYGVQAPRMKG